MFKHHFLFSLGKEASMKRTVIMLALMLAVVIAATLSYGPVALAQQATKMRWDIITLTSFTPPTVKEGGVAFAYANDGSYIKLKGSGTFGPQVTAPVTGGGEWETFNVGNDSTGKGKYTVTGLVGFEVAAGTMRPAMVDNIGDKADARAGLAVLRIAYTKEDGSSAGTGILVVSCHLPVGSSDAIFEGIIASQGVVMYFNRMPAMPGVDANRTVFHVVR